MEPVAVLLRVVSAAILFACEKVRVDDVAVVVPATPSVSGLLTPAETPTGSSSIATPTVAARFMLSGAPRHTSVVRAIAALLGADFGPVAALSAFVHAPADAVVPGPGGYRATEFTRVGLPWNRGGRWRRG